MKTIYFICILLFVSTCLYSTIINVPADQATIQAGIDISVDADTVLVQPGTYFENINYIGKNITIASLFLTTQDTTYISQTVIDGDSIDSVVKFESSEDSTAVLTGFTITNGYAEFGGGIYCYDSSPNLQNVTITENSAEDYGGGIYCCYSSNPCLTNVIISENTACRGGGIFCRDNSSPNLQNVTITDNSATGYLGGGGIHCIYNSSPSLQDVTITENSAEEFGGGIFCCYSSNPCLTNVIISGNTACGSGGIHCFESSPSLTNVTISGNTAYSSTLSSAGGGIYCFSNSNPSLVNVTITGNFANKGGGICCSWYSSPSLENVTISGNTADYGGGIYCRYNSSPSLQNVTITDNSAGDHGGGIYCSDSSLSLVNCIMWDDSPEEIYGSVTVTYSDIQGGWVGTGNIDEDPLFVGTGGYPFSLLEDSPCIDAGNPDPIYYDPEDPSNPGYALYPAMGTIINDMGAYGGPNTIGWPPVGLEDNVIVQIPEVLLHQNYPNPFNPETTISFSVTQTSSFVTLEIYNIKGQKVKTLVNEVLPAGEHSIIWNGKDSNGNRVGSGIYFYKLKTGDFQKVRKMILLK